LQLGKQQAEAGDIVLLYGDESEALTHLYLARVWEKTGADLRVPTPGQAHKVALLGSLDYVTRQLIVHIGPTKRSSDFVVHLEQFDWLYGPKLGQPVKPVVARPMPEPPPVIRMVLPCSSWTMVRSTPASSP
jgi:hypothetical protein